MNRFVLEAEKLICDYSDSDGDVRGVVVEKLKIPKVGVTVIFGGSGSGKSTLLSIITGSRQPTQISDQTSLEFINNNSNDKIDLIGNNLASRGSFGFIFQEPHLIKTISARSNAEIAQRYVGHDKNSLKIDELASEFEVLDVLSQRADTLSGGQAQRIAVIRALALNPEILVCDEPTSSLDEETGQKLLSHIYDWAHMNGKSVLLVTHNLEQAAQFGDYYIRVENGELKDLNQGEPICLIGASIREKLAYLRMNQSLNAKPKIIEPSIDQAVKKIANAKTFGAVRFTWHIMLESFFLKKSQQHFSSKPTMVMRSWYAPLADVSIIGLLTLGLIVFIALLKVQTVGAQYFERELSRPELRHFTIKQNQVELDLQSTTAISNALSSRIGLNDDPIIFTRRETFIQTVLPSEDGICPAVNPRRVRGSKNAPMLVYEQSEPLYADFASYVGNGNIVPNSVLATRGTFLDAGSEPPFLCVDIDGDFVSRNVIWIDDPIPGGADRTFVLGMSEESFREASAEVQSTRFQDKRFSEIAVYFDEATRDDILCMFDAENSCEEASSYAADAFLINKEVFTQIKNFTTLSYAARQAIFSLVAAFILVMSVAVGFSMNAEVKNQEKALAILRAFGVSSFQISAFFQLRTVIQTFYVFAIVVVLFILSKGQINQILSESDFKIELIVQYADLLIPIILSIILTQVTTFGVVIIWALRNKFVSERLQGL